MDWAPCHHLAWMLLVVTDHGNEWGPGRSGTVSIQRERYWVGLGSDGRSHVSHSFPFSFSFLFPYIFLLCGTLVEFIFMILDRPGPGIPPDYTEIQPYRM